MTVTWLGFETRRRWGSLVALALLVALTAGTVLAAIAGARRCTTVLRALGLTGRQARLAVYKELGFAHRRDILFWALRHPGGRRSRVMMDR